MEDLEEYIKTRLDELNELYDFYLNKLDNTYNFNEKNSLENRLHDLRIEMKTLEKIKEIIGD